MSMAPRVIHILLSFLFELTKFNTSSRLRILRVDCKNVAPVSTQCHLTEWRFERLISPTQNMSGGVA